VHNGGPAGPPFKGRPGFFARNGEKVSETLQLTDDQVATIELIRESFRAELRGLAEAVKAGTIERSEAKNQMQTLSDAMRAELNAVLTDDQRAIRDTMHAEREAQHEANVAAGREAMITVLGLDASQVEALENLRSTIDEERLEFRELIEGGATREEIQELASAAHAANLAALSGILDTTQFEIFVIHGAISSRMKRRMGPRNHGMRQN
jgi:Spy/CpxP family protein refolding chaperone